jgi:2-succinyl-6-hydroxy-2,4-cyclohexadiene-1-carboxylate synthase
VTLFCLHGFLGQPTDYQWVLKAVREQNVSIESITPDYLAIPEISSSKELSKWGGAFNKWVLQQPSSHQRVLVGYSQGGRLALHALKHDPDLWAGAILISANPGLAKAERAMRLANDERWAQLFLTESFEWLLGEWNKQAVFAGSINEPERFEKDYDRRQLSECLFRWSSGHQEDFRPFLKTLQKPVLWVTGAEDKRYVAMAEPITNGNSHIQSCVIEKSGHRVIFDQPEDFGKKMAAFLKSLA